MGSRSKQIVSLAEIPEEAGGLVGYGDSGDSPGGPLPAPPTQARGVDKRDRIYDAAIARYAG